MNKHAEQLPFPYDIRPRSPEEQAERRSARQREKELAEETALLDEIARLRSWTPPERIPGRPPLELPQPIAVLVVADIEAGLQYRDIVEKYRRRFSLGWLSNAVNSGRLRQMAGMVMTEE